MMVVCGLWLLIWHLLADPRRPIKRSGGLVEWFGLNSRDNSGSVTLRGVDVLQTEADYLDKNKKKKNEEKENEEEEGEIPSIFNYEIETIKGQRFSLRKYAGKRAGYLIVNVASNCGYTRDTYRELEILNAKYKDSGLEIIAFPTDDFKQEPNENKEIETYVRRDMGSRIPLLCSKISVNGPNKHPLFEYLEKNSPNRTGDIKWNFEKFLVNAKGVVVKRYKSEESPMSFEDEIKKVLSEYDGNIEYVP